MTRSIRDTIAVVPDPDDAAAAFASVDSLLRSERSLLQRLLYQLSAQELVIRAGRIEWLRDSDLEVRILVCDLATHELRRASETDLLAARYGLKADVPLRTIVAAAPEPWTSIMDDHLRALRSLQDAVDRTAERNGALLRGLRDQTPDDGRPGRSAR